MFEHIKENSALSFEIVICKIHKGKFLADSLPGPVKFQQRRKKAQIGLKMIV